MSRKALGLICAALFAVLSDAMMVSAGSDPDAPPWMPDPGPGEDALVVRRNAFMNKLAEAENKRVTIVKFDDNLETKCPTLTSLLFSTGNRLELSTPNFSLHGTAGTYVYSQGNGSDSAEFVIRNAACRYVLTVNRYDRDGDVEKEVRARDLAKIDQGWTFLDTAGLKGDRNDWIGLNEAIVPFDNPANPLNFTGIAFFAPTTFTVFLANTEKDLTIGSESNFLNHTYKVEIKNAQATLRISINKELYSNGQWVNAYGK
jgi:hypothetical protein